ncbi:MAG: hypothetical protein IB616_01325 [Methanosarcinales archaeon]|nr:MAG: hypothetical protein IB616_01325 [Methanosarcinales archaeon]
MPRKIENPILDGLPSKIYCLAYGAPISGYEIGQKIQRVKNPRTDQIYKIVSKEYEHLFKRTERKGKRGLAKPILSRAEPLLKLTEEDLARVNKELDDKERGVLLKFLKTSFRKYMKEYANVGFVTDRPYFNIYDELVSCLVLPYAIRDFLRDAVGKSDEHENTTTFIENMINTMHDRNLDILKICPPVFAKFGISPIDFKPGLNIFILSKEIPPSLSQKVAATKRGIVECKKVKQHLITGFMASVISKKLA